GMVLTAASFLDEQPDPRPAAVRLAIAGNLCRCTGYQKIVEAVLLAAQRLREGASGATGATGTAGATVVAGDASTAFVTGGTGVTGAACCVARGMDAGQEGSAS
ncbi:MAG: 2Fe-2S iron-sulfur cluster-binding protein, partial [Pseudomonadota bacterium]